MLAIYVHVLTGVSSLRSRFDDRTKGATAVEYGLMVALIAAVIIGAVIILGDNLNTIFTDVGDSIGGVGSEG